MADSTQFLIELAAKFTGGDASAATLSTIGDRMLAAGATAEDFERTIKGVSGALEESGAALRSANDAVSAGEQSYKQAEIAADRAAKAVERLASSGKSGDAFAKRQADAVAKSEAAAAALSKEAGSLDLLKSKAAAAAGQHDALTKGLKNLKGAAEQASSEEDKGTGSLRSLASGLGKLGGPAGEAGSKVVGLANAVKKIGSSLGSVGPYVAAAVAIIAIATAALVATAAIAKWGVAMADTNRTNSLLAQGVARSVEGGEALDRKITDLGAVVPQTREELLGMADDLSKTGLRGKALTDALETAAVKAARLKFGPDFSKQMLSLDVQSRRLHDNIAATFGGLKIEGLLGGLSKLVALFDSSTVSGQTLKFLFESLFQPIIDGASAAIPKVERLFLYAEIYALKAYIALKPYHDQIKAVGEALLLGAGIILGVVVVALGAFVFSIGLAVGLIGALIYGLYKAEEAMFAAARAVLGAWDSAIAFMTDLGTKMIEGLVNGITGAGAAVVDAVKNVIGGAIKGAENLLKIGSPSKVFEEMGGFTAEGFAGGVSDGAGDARSALEDMVAPPKASTGAGASARGGVVLNIESVNVNGQNAKEQALDFLDQVGKLLEADALGIGGGEVPA